MCVSSTCHGGQPTQPHLPSCCWCCVQSGATSSSAFRQNQELEQDSVTMQEEQRKLQHEAKSLAQRLEAVLQDKFTPRNGFDADTPIDKTLQFLQRVIAVCLAS